MTHDLDAIGGPEMLAEIALMTDDGLEAEIARLTRVFAVFRPTMGPYEQLPISRRRRACREELERRRAAPAEDGDDFDAEEQ